MLSKNITLIKKENIGVIDRIGMTLLISPNLKEPINSKLARVLVVKRTKLKSQNSNEVGNVVKLKYIQAKYKGEI